MKRFQLISSSSEHNHKTWYDSTRQFLISHFSSAFLVISFKSFFLNGIRRQKGMNYKAKWNEKQLEFRIGAFWYHIFTWCTLCHPFLVFFSPRVFSLSLSVSLFFIQKRAFTFTTIITFPITEISATLFNIFLVLVKHQMINITIIDSLILTFGARFL